MQQTEFRETWSVESRWSEYHRVLVSFAQATEWNEGSKKKTDHLENFFSPCYKSIAFTGKKTHMVQDQTLWQDISVVHRVNSWMSVRDFCSEQWEQFVLRSRTRFLYPGIKGRDTMRHVAATGCCNKLPRVTCENHCHRDLSHEFKLVLFRATDRSDKISAKALSRRQCRRCDLSQRFVASCVSACKCHSKDKRSHLQVTAEVVFIA